MVVASLKEVEWSCYGGGHSLIEREWSCYRGGHFNGRSHVTQVVFNGGSLVMLHRSV